MNTRYSLLLLGAVLFIVSQMFGEDSTIVSLASSDIERTRSMPVDRTPPAAQLVRPAEPPPRGPSGPSLDEFYGGSNSGDDFADGSSPLADEDADVEAIDAYDPDDANDDGGRPAPVERRNQRTGAAKEPALNTQTIPDF